MKIVVLLMVLLLLAFPAALFFLSSAPTLTVESPPTVIGADTPIKVKMLALRLRAMAESDLPKQAAQAHALGWAARKTTAARMGARK